MTIGSVSNVFEYHMVKAARTEIKYSVKNMESDPNRYVGVTNALLRDAFKFPASL